MRITTLFCDVGGVLLTNGWDRHARARAADRFGLDLDDLNERHHLTFDTYEVGKLTLDSYLQRIVFHTERDFAPAAFRAFMFEQSEPLPGMIEYATRLKAAHGLRVVAVSNEGRELTEHRIAAFGLATLFDAFVSSSFVHLRKPDADIFQLAIDVAQADPAASVYLDDRPLFVEVARSVGLRGVVHRSLDATQDALAALGLPDPARPDIAGTDPAPPVTA